jgi:acyl dehydratase
MSVTVDRPEALLAMAGTDLGASAWLEVTQAAIDDFADATGDHQWIHVDIERAREGPFGRTVAHGYLTLAMVIPMWSELLRVEHTSMAINYGLDRVRFPAPVPVGSRVRGRFTVLSVESVGGGDQAVIEGTVEREGGEKPVCVAELVLRFLRAA